MVKAIFFDIDGTLLSHRSGTVPSSARAALLRLKERGVLLFAATGRHILELEKLPVRDLPFDGYATLNGQICLDGHKTLLYSAPIPPEDAQQLAAAFAAREVPMMIVEAERIYVNFINDAVRTAQRAISTPVPEIGVYTGAPMYQFDVYADEAHLPPLIAQLPHCKASRWNPYAIDVMPRSGGKVAGIRRILEHFHLTPQEIMAFGDGENDLDMLRCAGIGVAMGNADEAVKQSADHVTAGVDQDGIREALAFFGLI